MEMLNYETGLLALIGILLYFMITNIWFVVLIPFIWIGVQKLAEFAIRELDERRLRSFFESKRAEVLSIHRERQPLRKMLGIAFIKFMIQDDSRDYVVQYVDVKKISYQAWCNTEALADVTVTKIEKTIV